MSEIDFFRTEKVMLELSSLENFCRNVSESNQPSYNKAIHLLTIMGFISSNREQFSLRCSCNIQWFGDSIGGKTRDLNRPVGLEHLDLYLVLFYRLVSELEVSTPDEVALELTSFISYVESCYSELGVNHQSHIDFVKNKMPTAILKNLLNSKEIGYLGSVPKIASEVKAKVSNWSTTLDAHVTTVDNLKRKLDEYENAFNFVGLHKGFSVLYDKKVKDLEGYQCNMRIFGCLIFLVFFVEFSVIALHPDSFDFSKIPFVASLALISLSMTLLLVYFFRISLRNADSCKSQIVQIELRKTLCEFVQSYATYATDIRSKSPDILSKFEAVVFSNIVLDEDKMISMFEGFEQATNFMKAAKGNA